MRKIVNILMWVTLPLFAMGQGAGIKFQQFKNWQEVLKASKESKKAIFIDAYATWCVPCKKMDSVVYTDEQLGKYMNNNFIAIKVQFDKTKYDDEVIKGWYDDAAEMQRVFAVQAFPTFLFISPEAQLIEKGVGFQPVDQFFGLARRANDPSSNFASLVLKFRAGQLSDKDIFAAALLAKEYKLDSLAFELAKVYKQKVIDTKLPEQVLSPEGFKFFTSFYKIFSPADGVIKFMYQYPEKADALMEQKYSGTLTYYLIYNAIITPYLKAKAGIAMNEPEWKKLQRGIARRYDANLAKRMIVNAKLSWYSNKKDWPNIVKYSIERTDLAGIDTTTMGAVNLNNMVYNVIFKHSANARQLKKGLEYMCVLLKKDSTNHFWIDTYASLLYKAGKHKEAIAEQKRAIFIAEKTKDLEAVKELTLTLEQMQDNKVIWEDRAL